MACPQSATCASWSVFSLVSFLRACTHSALNSSLPPTSTPQIGLPLRLRCSSCAGSTSMISTPCFTETALALRERVVSGTDRIACTSHGIVSPIFALSRRSSTRALLFGIKSVISRSSEAESSVSVTSFVSGPRRDGTLIVVFSRTMSSIDGFRALRCIIAAASLNASASRIWLFSSLSVVSTHCSDASAAQRRSIASAVYVQPSSGFPSAPSPQRPTSESSSVWTTLSGACSSSQMAATADAS